MIAEDIRRERAQLVETLRAAGPDAPTLAHGWRAADLASHVAAQDRMRGIPARLARTAVVASGRRLSRIYLHRQRASLLVNGPTKPWRRSLEMLEKPPPRAVLAPRIASIALWEHFVHHEDVRRPAGLPRDAAPDLEPVLEWIIRYNRRALDRPLRIDTGDAVREIGDGGQPTNVRGSIADVVMWLSGRDAPGVELDGSPSDTDSLRVRLSV